MNDFLAQVIPETRALIWFPRTELDANSIHYRNVDYLCDGILTSSVSSLETKSSLVLIGKNFGSSLMIFVAKAIVKKEVESFFNLIPKTQEGEILVVDDSQLMNELNNLIPADMLAKIKRVT